MPLPLFSDSGIQLPIRPHAIAFDLDGTLLDYDGHLSESVARAVRLIRKTGIRIFIITGRMQGSAEKYWRELELDTPITSCNGAAISFPDHEPLFHARLGPEARDIVMDFEAKHGVYINYYIDNAAFTLHDGALRDEYARQFNIVALARGRDDILSRNLPTKCLCITSEDEQPATMDALTQALGGHAAITRSNTRYIEILPPGIDKGTALLTLAKWAGIPPAQFVAVGDARNDIPMLERAGFAIGFKSGDPDLALHVDMLLPPLWEDGVEILAKCILGMTNSGRFLTARSNRFFRK